MASADYTNVVQSLYVAYFGRPADFFGLQNFTSALNAANAPTTLPELQAAYRTSPTIKALIDSFGTSTESTVLYSGDTLSFVSSIYQNVLGRSADLDGLLFWTAAINSGTLTKANAAVAIMSGAMNNPIGPDASTVANKIAAATEFTNALDTFAEITGYSGDRAASQARAFLSTVTSEAPSHALIENTIYELTNFDGLNTPKPVAITNTVSDYSTSNQVNLVSDFTTAPIKQGAVPGYYPNVLSYVINDKGEIVFSGTFANSLTPEDKAGDILAILQNMPGTACSFVQFNKLTQTNDTYLVCTGTGTTGPAVIDIVGVSLNGVDNINIVEPTHWSG